jgi:uncharacterized protein YfaT (DUF1175 family)
MKQNLYKVLVNKLFDTPKKNSILLATGDCTIKDVSEQGNDIIFIQGNDLFIGKEILDQDVQDIIFSSGVEAPSIIMLYTLVLYHVGSIIIMFYKFIFLIFENKNSYLNGLLV